MSTRRRRGGSSPYGRKVDGKKKRKIQKVLKRAGDKGLSRLAIHMVERANLAKMKGENGEHWMERQYHKQYDEEGRERVQGVIQEIRQAGLWPW
jgi:hypothetical protein